MTPEARVSLHERAHRQLVHHRERILAAGTLHSGDTARCCCCFPSCILLPAAPLCKTFLTLYCSFRNFSHEKSRRFHGRGKVSCDRVAVPGLVTVPLTLVEFLHNFPSSIGGISTEFFL